MTLRQKWIVIFGALIVQGATSGFTLATFTLWAEPWMKSFGTSHSGVMSAIMLTLCAGGLFSPLMGYLADRMPLRTMMICGTLVFGASLIAISFATTMWQVSLLYAVPVAASMVATGPLIGQIIAVRLFQPQAGFAIGVVTLGLSIGGFIVPAIAAGLLSGHDWRECFQYLSVGITLLCLPVAFFLIPSLPAPARQAAEGPATDSNILSAWAILRDRVFWGALLILFPLTAFFNAVYYSIGPWLADMHYAAQQVAPLISLTAIVATLGIITFGWLVDRLDARLLFLIAFLLNGGGMAIAASAPHYGELIVTLPLMGFATGGMIPLLAAIMVKRFGVENFGRANGLSLVFSTMAIIGALLAGFGRDMLGNYPTVFAIGLIGLGPCILGFVLLKPAVPQSGAVPVRGP